jgi:type IV pilus biogenesis protein CpaD/CtpE
MTITPSLGKSTWTIGGRGGLGIKVLVVAAMAAIGCVTWMTTSGPSDAQNQRAPASSPVVVSEQATSSLNPTITRATLVTPAEQATPVEAITPEEPAPVDGLRISSQSWRRGGLGSKALITFTLRNGNEYAVKDIEIACAFARRDGSHLTDRTRMIHDTVNMKSRKTFARLHVGFVNINANKAKCALVAASHI